MRLISIMPKLPPAGAGGASGQNVPEAVEEDLEEDTEHVLVTVVLEKVWRRAFATPGSALVLTTGVTTGV